MDYISSDGEGKFVWKKNNHSSTRKKAFYGWTKNGKLIQADMLYIPPKKSRIFEALKKIFK